jgi:hypothetical protein
MNNHQSRADALRRAGPVIAGRPTVAPVCPEPIAAAFQVAELMSAYLHASKYLVGDRVSILARLEERGLHALIEGYVDAFDVLRTLAELECERPLHLRASGDASGQDLDELLARVLPADLGQQPPARFVATWAGHMIPPFQAVLEALHVEAGLGQSARLWRVVLERSGGTAASGGSAIDQLSAIFHERVKTMYATIGMEYFPLRLYRDSVLSPTFRTLVRQTRSVYPFPHTDALHRAGLNIPHGLALRVFRPGLRRLHPEASSRDWDGLFEYAVVAP